ncbi:MAG: gephyrin-like molybdotransferase Glp [Paracoccaceae bacterium]
MSAFHTFAMVDWSGGNDRGPTPRADAIWTCLAGGEPTYHRNRQVVEDWLTTLIDRELTVGRCLCLGFDFPFGYPQGFARAVAGTDDPLVLWNWLETRIEDAPKSNNRFNVAAQINRQLGTNGPFWGNGLKRDIPGLPRTRAGYENPFAERRVVEEQTKGAFTCWQLAGAGSVGSQVLMGLPVLARLRRRFPDQIAVWPFEPLDRPIAFVEIWPSLLADQVKARMADEEASGGTPIKDAIQVQTVANALADLPPDRLADLLDVAAPEEGWILGSGRAHDLLPMAPPPLRNDCFALPPGVNWTPVDDALAMLRTRLRPVTSTEHVHLSEAQGRILARPLTARRSNPPQPNTAVDGYGFAGPAGEGLITLPIHPGRAAAGVPFDGVVPPGHALRVLTGAALPKGVDTVVLDEDTSVDADHAVAFHGPLKQGANTRKAGEDVAAGDTILPEGRRLTAADLALISATGIATVPVRRPLQVAVISTGDELVEPGAEAGPGQIFDANRPMLIALLRDFGADVMDLGRIPDDRAALRAALDQASQAGAILTSGGASAGEEDHVSALLTEAGAMQEWRIAIKPGRPLALGLWNGTPVFGLPGNPVAAMVCTLIFARPALAVLAGADWPDPQGFMVPAAFTKSKKPGRREFLRARIRDGRAEVFHSEGSGRISGLSWAEGLVELPDGAHIVQEGDPVRYIPFASFGVA